MEEYKVNIFNDGSQLWYNKKGQLHREDGPAIIWNNGKKEYWLNNIQVSEEEVMSKKKYTIEEIQQMTVSGLLNKLKK